MISVAEAWERIHERVRGYYAEGLPAARYPFQATGGLVLAEPVSATCDSPPHDKSLVDGYAIHSVGADLAGAELTVLEQVTAGQVPTRELAAGCATRIMTGAPIPAGTAAVVMVERTLSIPDTASDAGKVRILETPRLGQNIMRRGESMRQGEVVLRPGHRLRGIELGLLAELGVTEIAARPRPTVAIVATGDELVGWDKEPGPGQIRNSNGPMLEALVHEAGGLPTQMTVARDRLADLTEAIRAGLAADVLLLSGGVSAGVLDLVPAVLEQLGVEQVFHRVNLKPGQPLWFGVRSASRPSFVFGLPGNPVSSLVCFHLFAGPTLRRLAGRSWGLPPATPARLTVPFRQTSARATYFPCRVDRGPTGWRVTPLGWRGSADLKTLVDAQGLLCLEPGEYELPTDADVQFHWLGDA